MWVLIERKTGSLHLIGRGRFDPSAHDMRDLDLVYVPEQPTGHLYVSLGECFPPRLVGTLADLKQYANEKAIRQGVIDAETGSAISKAVHAQAGLNEEIGILRDQLVQILNALGIEPTADFARLNALAIAEIEKARIEKESL